MSPILLFFVFPIATIIFAIALERILNSPLLVGAIIFAIFLIVTFVSFTVDFLIYAIVYGLLAVLTAYLAHLLFNLFNNLINNSDDDNLPNTRACRICNCQRKIYNCMTRR